MLLWCQTRTLYKGLFALVLALIVFEYLSGIFIQKIILYPYSATRVQFPEKAGFQQHPLSKALSYIQNLDVYTNKTNSTVIPLCPDIPPNLWGRLKVVKSPIPSVLDLEKRFYWLKRKSHSLPDTCRAIEKVAIVVPFRYRGEHLLIFLQHMHPLLRKQQLDYTIFVIEQDGTGIFNRAMLMNIGFTEALKISDFDCFIFHDVDLLPEDDRNLYTCPEQPRHMSVAVDSFNYTLPYRTIFGGVSAISTEHFRLLNGFSNLFWGWGGEDDDMSNRIRYHKLCIFRYPKTVARYSTLNHKKETPTPNRKKNLKSGQKRFDTDGLNSLRYTIKDYKQHILYTWLLMELEPPSIIWSRFLMGRITNDSF